MTPARVAQLLPVMQAFAEGKAIRYRKDPKREWSIEKNPTFTCSGEYEIAPRVPLKLYRVEYPNGNLSAPIVTPPPSLPVGYKLITFQEVQ